MTPDSRFRCCLGYRWFGGLIALAMLAGCASSSHQEWRNGYVADHSHRSSAFNQRIRYLVLHYTDSEAPRALRTLMGPNVSSHYLVPRQPEQQAGLPVIWQLVDEDKRAWHAGISAWEERTQLNDTSIGIEIVNDGPRDTPQGRTWQTYPDKQIDAVIALARDIVERYGLPPTAVVAHADIAPRRKIDPGPRFPWKRLFEAGVGAWPNEEDVARYHQYFTHCPPSIAQYQRALRDYGYRLEITGNLDAATRDVTRAFQMHFRPASYSGQPDAETAAIAWALLTRYRPHALDDARLAPPETCPADARTLPTHRRPAR